MATLKDFNRVDSPYRTVNGYPIETSVFVPKNVPTDSVCPVLVHFHGGGFIVGHRLYEPWYATW